MKKGRIAMKPPVMKNLPKVSIIVLTYNRVSQALECIKSLKSLIYPNYEILLVDNSSTLSGIDEFAKQQGFQLIDITGNENLGASGGRNIGIKHSKGEYIFFVDDDVIVEGKSLLDLVTIAERDPSIGIIGPLMYRYDNPNKMWFYQNFVAQHARRIEVVDVPLVVAGALLVKRDVIRKIGLFDDNYFFYHEEWDLCFRARKAGYRTVCATKARSWHKVPLNEQGKLYIPKRAYFWHRNFFIFAGRHYRKTKSAFNFLFKNLVFYGHGNFPCFYILFALRKRKFDALKSYFQGIIDGIIWYLKLRLLDQTHTHSRTVPFRDL